MGVNAAKQIDASIANVPHAMPSGWRLATIGEMFDVAAGGDLDRGSFSAVRDAAFPFPIFANAHTARGLYGYSSRAQYSGEKITVTARGDVGHAEYRRESFSAIGRLLVLSPREEIALKLVEECINNFVTFALESTGVPQLTAPQIAKYQIKLPVAVAEQRRIAEALSDADALIEELERLIAKKRAIKQGVMQVLLSGRRRLPGFSGEWGLKRVGELGDFLKGKGVRKDEARSGQLPCVRYGEIYTDHRDIVRDFRSFISESVAASATRVGYGDILFAGSGETKDEIGKCVAIAHKVAAFAGGDIIILRTKSCDPAFLGYALNQPAIQKQKASKGQGDAVVHISARSLGALEIMMPPLHEQRSISEVIADHDVALNELEAKLSKARALKQGMMQELLTGRVRLA